MRRERRLQTLANVCFLLTMYSLLCTHGSSQHENLTGQGLSFQSAWECPTELMEEDRVDCHPELGASETECKNRGCEWCEADNENVPWCFHNTKPGFDGTCSSSIPFEDRCDCYPMGGVSNAKCVNKGCTYCPVDNPVGTPWCFYEYPQEDSTKENERIDCHPDPGASKCSCHSRKCVWSSASQPDAPWCYYPVSYRTYNITSQVDTAKGSRATLAYVGSPIFSNPVMSLTVDVEYQTDYRLRVKIYDTDNARFEVPLDIPSPSTKASNPQYSVSFSNVDNFSFKVTRNSNGETIFDTSLSGFTFEDQFIQIATKLEQGSGVFGFGETEHSCLCHDMNWKKYSMWSRDNPPWGDTNIYSVHPYYTVINQGMAHGVLFLNANAQDLDVSPLPYLNFRTIGGVLDFYFFLGPTPEDVVSQYTEAVGRPYMPAYWSLGFQLCRYGYNSLQTLQATVDRMRSYQIPFDVQYGDIDYMDQQRDFTYDTVNYNGLPGYVDTLHSYGMKYIIILDPCIDITVPNYPAYEEGQAKNIWVQHNGQPASAKTKVWPPGTCYFPDYFLDDTQQWWTKQCSDFHNVIKYDGLWIDMNEPANFVHGTLDGCPNNTYNYPPYKPRTLGNVLAEKTTCPDATQDNGKQLHYNVHSLYGWTQARQTVPAMRAALGGNKRGIVISRSTFPGSGKWTGHWLGDNFSNWYNLRVSIIGCLEFNMFGIPYIGADICGFNEDSNEELCQRWMQLGAFYTFSRNHNGLNWREQDPAVWGNEVARVSRESLEIRYTLLPYLYTLFYHSHVKGSTVMRPLFHEFPSEELTYGIDEQFLWGPAFLISPVLYQGATTVNAYFPYTPWYDYYTGTYLNTRGGYTILSAPMDYIPLHVRGGYILPTQEPAVTTTESRNNPMGLIVALDDYEKANGDLFWDEGDTADTIENENYYFATFIADGRSLTSTLVKDAYRNADSLMWGTIRVFGVKSASTVTVNGYTVPYDYNMATQVLTITDINIPITTPINVYW
ncbi:Maltase-glucoamylase, intestinal [Holothuria leucospilota]|uniref:Maltase n=1 Tax=Holothuria leucospilota TaxID=206669 RepID=A0A9Q1BJF8_HOLLE|nr:Maltase-glucoamylase, intestinal [Holothuria leucospilota]